MRRWKSLYERFQEDYTAIVVPASNKNGFKIDYVYYAPWFVWNLPEHELRQKKREILLLTIIELILFSLSAWNPSLLNALAFVAYPSIISMLAFILGMIGVLQFYFAKYRTTKSTFQQANRRITLHVFVHMLASAIASLGCAYYMVCYDFPLSFQNTLLLFTYGVDAMIAFVVLKQYREIPFTTEKNDTLQHVERAVAEA